MTARPDHPTASGVERLVLCPGSWQLEQKAPAQEQSEDAATGDRIHAILAGKEVEASEDEMECAIKCIELRDKVISEILFDKDASNSFRETRLFLPGVEFSGMPDYVLHNPAQAFIADYKTGRNEVASAEGNWQLLSLAVLLHAKFPEIGTIFVCIVQPWASPQVSVCKYNLPQLQFAKKQLEAHLLGAYKTNPPRMPGEKQCKYCKAKSICPEAQNQVAALVPSDVYAMTPAKIGELLDRCSIAEGVIESIRIRAKEILFQEPEAIPGWSLEPGAKRRVIEDAEKAYQKLAHVLNGQEFASCCKVAIGKLERAVQLNRKMTAKEAKHLVNTELNGVIKEEQNKPSLVKSEHQLTDGLN